MNTPHFVLGFLGIKKSLHRPLIRDGDIHLRCIALAISLARSSADGAPGRDLLPEGPALAIACLAISARCSAVGPAARRGLAVAFDPIACCINAARCSAVGPDRLLVLEAPAIACLAISALCSAVGPAFFGGADVAWAWLISAALCSAVGPDPVAFFLEIVACPIACCISAAFCSADGPSPAAFLPPWVIAKQHDRGGGSGKSGDQGIDTGVPQEERYSSEFLVQLVCHGGFHATASIVSSTPGP